MSQRNLYDTVEATEGACININKINWDSNRMIYDTERFL